MPCAPIIPLMSFRWWKIVVTFTVLLAAKDAHRSIIFSLAEHAIVVRDDKSTKTFEAFELGRALIHSLRSSCPKSLKERLE
jgi:hypothetical protein